MLPLIDEHLQNNQNIMIIFEAINCIFCNLFIKIIYNIINICIKYISMKK